MHNQASMGRMSDRPIMKRRTRKLTYKARRTARQGGLLVEFALTIGLAFFFFFAAMEFSRVAQLRHTIDHATYEACRVGVVPGATAEQVEARARQVMGTAFSRNFTVQVSPNPIRTDSPTISVTVGMPLDQNLITPPASSVANASIEPLRWNANWPASPNAKFSD